MNVVSKTALVVGGLVATALLQPAIQQLDKSVAAAEVQPHNGPMLLSEMPNIPGFTRKDLERIVATSRGNELRFNRDYKGRWFKDTLTFDSMEQAFLSSDYHVSFKGVDCYIGAAEAQKLIEWDTGKLVEVSGFINTTVMGDLKLDSCKFEPKP